MRNPQPKEKCAIFLGEKDRKRFVETTRRRKVANTEGQRTERKEGKEPLCICDMLESRPSH